jgi:hypothetical protein
MQSSEPSLRSLLDAEFNGFGRALISIGLVCADGREWYEVAEIPAEPHQGEQIGTPT